MKIMLAKIAEQKLPFRYIGIVGGFAVTGLLLIGLWSEIAEGELAAIDSFILLLFRQPDHLNEMIGPTWLRQTMLDITTLGGRTVITLVILGSAGFMIVKGAYRIATLIVGATVAGSLVVVALKGILERPRPAIVDHLVAETSMSFPSGHAANSAIVYLTIAVLFMRLEPNLRTRLFVLGVAVFMVTAIGISRVALGVHWPSDVLAGWLFGTGWACFWALIVKLPATRIDEEVPLEN